MDWLYSKNVLFTFILSSFAFIGIPYMIWKDNGKSAISSSETIAFSGIVSSIRKTKTTLSRYGEPVIYISFQDEPYKFRIGGAGYRAINSEEILEEIHVGEKIEIDVKLSALQRSNEHSALNKVLEWRDQPIIYGLRKNEKKYLTISQFNSSQERVYIRNLYWGIGTVLLLTGLIIRASYKNKDNARNS